MKNSWMVKLGLDLFDQDCRAPWFNPIILRGLGPNMGVSEMGPIAGPRQTRCVHGDMKPVRSEIK